MEILIETALLMNCKVSQGAPLRFAGKISLLFYYILYFIEEKSPCQTLTPDSFVGTAIK